MLQAYLLDFLRITQTNYAQKQPAEILKDDVNLKGMHRHASC